MIRPALITLALLLTAAGLIALATAPDPDPFEYKESLDDIS